MVTAPPLSLGFSAPEAIPNRRREIDHVRAPVGRPATHSEPPRPFGFALDASLGLAIDVCGSSRRHPLGLSSMADPVGTASSPVTAGKGLDLDDMLAHLELREDELDDVVIPVEAVKEFQKDARWLAIGKVHTSRSFSSEALFGKMRAIWNLSRDLICREAGENLFIFQMHCLGDWKKVVHQGPWTFRGWAVLIEDYDGKEDPEKMTFNGLHIWAQIHGIPELYRKTEVIDDLARRIGKTKEVQMSPKLFFEGNYVRLRVIIDVNKPLMRFVSLMVEGEGRKRLAVKYEKIPFFCKRCGLLGHDHEECGDGAWEPKDLQYGEWMLAVRRSNTQLEPRRFAAPNLAVEAS
ncbi:hypothetical protein ACQ4PT_007450 [Festuca glaucescens]